ncbi:MAG: RluA family pseudouridine synthase [Nitrospirae bacterium]|nr:RluA family pseudouridine synthase [Nitrospirota bacterium]
MKPIKPIVSREFIVAPKFASERLDHYLIRHQLHPSRTFLQRLIKDGEVRVNDRIVKPHYKIRSGDHLVCRIPTPTPLDLVPESIPLDVLYEDSAIIVLNKPAGLVMHPAPGHYTGTLVHGLLAHFKDRPAARLPAAAGLPDGQGQAGLSGIGGRERPGLVHRLDKDTSGVIVVAKTDAAHRSLSQQFKSHSIERQYQAIVAGRLPKSGGTIDLAIGRDRWQRKKISHRTSRPREARTVYRVLERFKAATRVEVRPQTGRTHQIRVHFASLGHPILGDRVYGGPSSILDAVPVARQMLHAERLGFVHPEHGGAVDFSAPLPADMERILEVLRINKQP